MCFTANTSAAIKLVAESYPFAADAVCVLSADNHNSVNGIREYARRAGSRVVYLPLDADLRLDDAETSAGRSPAMPAGSSPFRPSRISPACSIRSSLVETAQALGFDVLRRRSRVRADACASACALPGRLRRVVVLQALRVSHRRGRARRAANDARATDAGRGLPAAPFDYASVQQNSHRLLEHAEGFEDGTPHFLGVSALDYGFQLLEGVTMPRLKMHVERLTSRLLEELASLRHSNGQRLVWIHGPADLHDRGGTVAFNLSDP